MILHRVLTTTAPFAILHEADFGAYPSLRPRVAWQLHLQTEDAILAYELRDNLMASCRYTAAKVDVLEWTAGSHRSRSAGPKSGHSRGD